MLPRFASLCICTAIVSLAQALDKTCLAGNCNSTLSVMPSGSDISSPCNPNVYPDGVSCKWSFATYNTSYTQLVLSSFSVEAWHDYVKLDGTENFIIFYNSTENQVIITGYPSGNISANLVTDSDTSYSGFSASFSAISENSLLDQYTDYRVSNSVQVLNSPMYLSSTQSPKGVSLDVMFINIPNTTYSPVDVWNEYAGLLSSPHGIEITDITATGFAANWTEVDGTKNYTLVVTDANGTELQRPSSQTTVLRVNNLPSGSTFNLTLIIINKVGNLWRLTGEATTDVTSVVKAEATHYTQTSFSLQWNMIKGASSYMVNITAYNFKKVMRPNSSPQQVDGLEPGVEYRVEVSAVFHAGVSGAIGLTLKTIPGNVTFDVQNVTTTSVILHWSIVQGADNYTVAVLENETIFKTSSYILNNPTISGLNPGRTYTITVTAVNGPGESSPAAKEITTKLIPDSARVWGADVTATGFLVRWTSITGATRYNLSISDSDGRVIRQSEFAGSVDRYKIDDLASGTHYTITLFVFNKPGSHSTLKSAEPVTTNVTVVQGVKVTFPGQDHFTVSWVALSGALLYKINVVGHGTNITNETNNISIFINGLDYGITYQIAIYAMFPSGRGPLTTINEPTVPGNVTIISAEAITTTTFTPIWSEARGAVSYIFELRKGGVIELTEAVNGSAINVKPGTKYEISVKAKNKAGSSSEATKIFTTGLDSPSGVKITGTTKNQFVLHWDNTTGATSYEYSCTPRNAASGTVIGSIQSNSVIISGLQPSTTYTCTVLAKTADVKSVAESASNTTGQNFCNPCMNGGTCDEAEEKCFCKPGYTGKTCQHVIDWCKEKTCAPANFTCTNNISKLTAVCKCNPGYTGDPEIRCIAYCPEGEGIGKDNITYRFNFTHADTTVNSVQRCTENGQSRSLASAVCRSRSTSDGGITSEFVDVFAVSCKLVIANITIKIDKDSNATTAELETQSAELQVLTSGDKVAEEDVQKVAQYMEDVAAIAEKQQNSVTKKVLTGMVSTADNLIASESIGPTTNAQTAITQAPGPTEEPEKTPRQKEKKIKEQILKSLTSLAEQVVIPNGTNQIVIETSNMVVKVVNEEVESSKQSSAISFAPAILTDQTRDQNAAVASNPLNISIPGSAIDTAKGLTGQLTKRSTKQSKQSTKQNVKISFFLHKDASLFPSDFYNPAMIIAASLGINLTLQNLRDDISYRYNDMKANPGISNTISTFYKSLKSHQCMFWDFELDEWSDKDCCLDAYDLSKCHCNHLTNFALMVSDRNIPADPVLDVVSDVGLGLSMIALALTIIIHCLNKDVRKRRPTQLLMNTCGSLFFSYLVFILGITKTENNSACTVIAAILQFLFLSSWCWMTVYSYDMYRSLVLVFNTSKSRYMTKCAIFGYGVPLLIVMLNVAVAVGYIDANKKPPGVCDNEDGYEHLVGIIPIDSSYVSGNMCWLQGLSMYIGFLLPVGLMLIFNFFVYAMVMKTLTQRGKVVQSSAKQMGSKDNILISITLTASTGLTWIIGYFMLLANDATYLRVMSWMFAIFNTLQGVVIFLTTCVRHENMRKIWLAPILHCCSRTSSRIRMLSPRSNEFDIQNMPDAGTSSIFSTTGNETTKTMNVHSISVKQIESESIL